MKRDLSPSQFFSKGFLLVSFYHICKAGERWMGVLQGGVLCPLLFLLAGLNDAAVAHDIREDINQTRGPWSYNLAVHFRREEFPYIGTGS